MVTLQDKLVHYLMRDSGWIPKGTLTRIIWKDNHGYAYLPETVGRSLRLAEEKKRIAVKYEGKNTLYKWIPHEMRKRYIPSSERKGDKLFTN